VRDDTGRLRDILEAIHRIDRHVQKGRHEFDEDELIQVWIVHHLQIIGEAARGLSSDFRSTHPEVPWTDVVAMRNLLVHEYFGVDLQEVWETTVNDLPRLREFVEKMLRSGL
jgi:uncharacterized protein with HEPN domain